MYSMSVLDVIVFCWILVQNSKMDSLPTYIERHRQVDIQSARHTYIKRQKKLNSYVRERFVQEEGDSIQYFGCGDWNKLLIIIITHECY